MRAERTAIIVAGMHRSGTSVTTRIVNLLGAALAEDLIPAGIGNERGHWESRAVQELHNGLLDELDSAIYSPVNIPSGWFASQAAQPWRERIHDLLESEYASRDVFVVKDPRMALFLPLWLEAMRSLSIAPRFVLPFRQPDAVAASLERRERRLDSGDALPHAQGVALWLRYVLAAEKYTRGQVRSFVAFDDLLGDWRAEFARIGRQLGIAWPNADRAAEQIDAFVVANAGVDDASQGVQEVPSTCREVYAGLQQALHDPTAQQPAFDAAANALGAAESLLGPSLIARERVFRQLLLQAEASARRNDLERAQMHSRFESELRLRDARIAEAMTHARELEQTVARTVAHATTLERERSRSSSYAKLLEQDRDRAAQHAQSVEQDRDRAAAHANMLEHDRDRGAEYVRVLEQDRDRAVAYASSLQQSRDEAIAYAQSLQQAQRNALQQQESRQLARAETPVFFTIASRNYLAYALTLMRSVAEQHPHAARYLILADRDAGDAALATAPFTTILAEALDLPDFDAFAFRYDIMEFNTAIKPFAFSHLRRLHPGAGVVYLDPDILLVAPLDQVTAAFAEGALAVLTPHLLEPIDDDRQPGEREILVSGTYNCGFVAIGAHAQADRLLGWWADRLEFGAVSDVAAGLFTDQKWVDLVPGLFADVHILRDAGYNVAYWNLTQRPVTRRAQHWYAGERPLVFVHFSGVDLDRPAQFSKHQNRHTQATIGELRPLYTDYLGRLGANGHADHRVKPYAFGQFADGEPICTAVREVFRRYFDKGATQAQRQPFSMDRTLFDLPCHELPVRAEAPVTRVMYAVWNMRVDLRRAFDIEQPQGRDGFMRWFLSTATAEMKIPARHLEPLRRALLEGQSDVSSDGKPHGRSAPGLVRRAGSMCLDLINWSCRFRFALDVYALIPQAARNRVRRRLERVARVGPPAPDAPLPQPPNAAGINLVGYAHGEFGVAEILRRYAQTLHGGSVPFVVRNFDVGVASRQSDHSMQPFLSEQCCYDVNVFCINADQMAVAREHLGDAVFAGRYNIGCWFWELEKFPEQWHGAIDLVDEIWVTSPFVREAIAACTSKPVHIVPVGLEMPLPECYSRAEFGLGDNDFVCLFSFDFNSFAARKNAAGAIAAFRQAFADGRNNVRLVIKTTNGERFPSALRALIDVAQGDSRIEVRDGFLDRNRMWALQACCDCYVSLHRSEGLGLGMAECMLLGKPVVATGYSGNLAFMDAQNSCLVGYELVPVREGEYPAWVGQHWAEPDIRQAATFLRRLADKPQYARELGKRAQASVRDRLSARASLEAINARLACIRAQPLD